MFTSERLNLNPGTLGSMPAVTRQAAQDFYSHDLGSYPLGQYKKGREILQEVRARVAAVWNTPECSVAIPNGGTTTTLSALAMALYPALLKKKIKVITSSHEHYGALFPFERHSGYEVEILADEILFDTIKFQQAIERLRPDVILLSQITYTAQTIPVEDLAESLSGLPNRPLFLVDSAQALGLIAKIPRVGPNIDLVVASGHKWLFGPPGSGLLWMSARLAELIKPFCSLGEPLDERAALGFLEASGGQDFSRLAALNAAIEFYEKTGAEKVEGKSHKLKGYFSEGLREILRNSRLEADYTESAGVLVIGFSEWDPFPLYNFLNSRAIHTKLIKTQKETLWRIGFPYYETTKRLDWALSETAQFFAR